MSQNLEDIAKLAGVSRSTVSRVINDHPNVNPATRERVMKIIQEQGFRPNLAARALVTRQTRCLSIVIPQAVAETFVDPYFPTLVQGITQKANQCDYSVVLWIGNSADEEERLCERIFNQSLFDGLIIASVVDNDPLLTRLAQAHFPFVLIGPPQFEHLNYIDVDNVRGAQLAVSHLIRLGWQRIGTITGPSTMGAAQDRLAGYRQALEHAGRAVDETLIVEGDFLENSGYLGMTNLLKQRVDAVFVASDMMALGAMRAIRERGLRIPDDIALIGFDDIPAAAAATPSLTTVRQPIRELGALASQVLIDLLRGTIAQPYQLVLPAELIIRETCGAARR